MAYVDDDDGDDIPLIRRRRGGRKLESSTENTPVAKRPKQEDIAVGNLGGLKEKLARIEAGRPTISPAKSIKKEPKSLSKTKAKAPAKAKKNGKASKSAKNSNKKSPSKGREKTQPVKTETTKLEPIPLAKEERFEVAAGENGDVSGGVHRWWDEDGQDNEVKWRTLSHHGVLFPPEYVPHNVPFVYDSEEIELSPASEEVATFYASKIKTDYVTKSTFNKNFFADFQKTLRRYDSDIARKIKLLSKCDFEKIWQHLEEQKNARKELPPAERKRIREEEAARVAKYTIALVDGREEKIGNFRLEPPALFLGRGEHPLAGRLKSRIMPEEVTINIGPDDPVPECPLPGHKWGKVVHNNTVTWLAMWKDSITGRFKYVFLGAGSQFKGMSDHQKFEKARKLDDFIDKIRKEYKAGFRSNKMSIRQRSVAIYFIDKLALRVGNEKGEDEADTVGCCSLRKEHINFQEPRTIEFDFLGKDSIRYVNAAEVEVEVFKNMKRFVKDKEPTADIFDRLTTTGLNEYLKQLMPGLSAKVFRTYNASITLNNLLQDTPMDRNVTDKLVFYNQQNKEVAILCNHQRALPKAHNAQMDKMTQKSIETEEWLSELEAGLKKLTSSKKLDSVEVKQWNHVKPEITPEMNEKQRAAAKEEAAKKPRVETRRTMKLEQLQRSIAQTKERIAKHKADMQTKEDLKTVALGTSKINYLDPRITVAWCKRAEVPIEKVFAKTLLTKFAWAMETSQDFKF